MLRFRRGESVSLVLGGGCERDTLPNDTLTSRDIARVSASCLTPRPASNLRACCCLPAACLLPACCLLLARDPASRRRTAWSAPPAMSGQPQPCLATHAWPMLGPDRICMPVAGPCSVACKQPRMHGLVAGTSLAVQFNCNQSYTSKDMQ